MNDIEKYLEEASIFEPVTVDEAEALLSRNHSAVIYIGRESCSFCRRFVSKLSVVANENNILIHYLHSQFPTANLAKIQVLRNKYLVPTVPGLIVVSDNGCNVCCDSTMSEDEILAFINGN